MAERLRTVGDIVELGAYFFSDEITYDDKAKSKWLRKEATPDTLERLADALEPLDEFSVEAVEQVARGLAEEMGVSRIWSCRSARVG